MAKRMFLQGNEAVGWGAVTAGCLAFFGYPITPQNEVIEWFARELPKRGGVFVQSQCETGSINMLFGAASTGHRAMTSTSSPGWALMQEGMSYLAAAEVPCVIVLVQRGGPGAAPTRHAQMDYTSATRGGGHGGYKTIVLAPASAQETFDLMQLAFYLADKHRTPVVVLTDAIVGQVSEPVELRKLDFGPLPEKGWALAGTGKRKDGSRRLVLGSRGIGPEYVPSLHSFQNKLEKIAETEVRWESYQADDAELILVAYGYPARVSEEAVNRARAEGLKVGLLRPITVWPFPYQAIEEKARQGANFLVVEDSLGQLVEDVRYAVGRLSQVHLLGVLARHIPSDGGMILPGRVLEEIKKLV